MTTQEIISALLSTDRDTRLNASAKVLYLRSRSKLRSIASQVLPKAEWVILSYEQEHGPMPDDHYIYLALKLLALAETDACLHEIYDLGLAIHPGTEEKDGSFVPIDAPKDKLDAVLDGLPADYQWLWHSARAYQCKDCSQQYLVASNHGGHAVCWEWKRLPK